MRLCVYGCRPAVFAFQKERTLQLISCRGIIQCMPILNVYQLDEFSEHVLEKKFTIL